MDVGAACLDRIGDAERARQALRDGAIGEEEAGVDDVEGLLFMQMAHQRQDRAGHTADIVACADLGNGGEDRAIDGEVLPAFLARQGAKRCISVAKTDRPDRYAQRRDHRDIDIGAAGEFPRLPFDEHPEIRTAHVREQGRERKDIQRHAVPLKASRLIES